MCKVCREHEKVNYCIMCKVCCGLPYIYCMVLLKCPVIQYGNKSETCLSTYCTVIAITVHNIGKWEQKYIHASNAANYILNIALEHVEYDEVKIVMRPILSEPTRSTTAVNMEPSRESCDPGTSEKNNCYVVLGSFGSFVC
jgi:hypothetical protein